MPGKPGTGLTRPHGLKFGTNFRTRGDDQWLDRHQEHRHDVDHGWQSSREPSLRFQVGGGGEAEPQCQADLHRSSLHPHGDPGRSVPADPRRHRYRVPWRAHQLRSRPRPRGQGIPRQLHECGLPHQRRFQATGRWVVLGFQCGKHELQQGHLELSGGWQRDGQGCAGSKRRAGARGT